MPTGNFITIIIIIIIIIIVFFDLLRFNSQDTSQKC